MSHSILKNNLSLSAHLAFTPLPEEWPYADKIYLLGTVKADPVAGVHIDIPADAPSMVLSAQIREELGLSVPTVQEAIDGVGVDKRRLIALGAGAHIRFGDRMAVFDRGGKTKFKPYHLNQPTGRLQTGPAYTAMAELNEELHVFKKLGNQLVPLLFTFNDAAGLSVPEKALHLQRLKEHQQALGQTLHITEGMIIVPLQAVVEDDIYASNIKYSVEGYELESSRMIPSFNADMHAFEFTYSLNVPKDIASSDLFMLSGEPLGREILLKTLAELDREKLAPALEAYHEMKKLGTNPQIAHYNDLMLRLP